MGFYGEVALSNKTSFQFDIVYPNRKTMDESCETDGVFLGRYVLVEYDNESNLVNGYFNPTDKLFYKDYNYKTPMTPNVELLYQDIADNTKFYIYDETAKIWIEIPADTSYSSNYNIDVTKYKRGYDSTAWMKYYNAENETYQYILIAELNTVTPTFVITVDNPDEDYKTPYFDSDSNNLIYYLHMPGRQQEVFAENKTKSDVTIKQQLVTKWKNQIPTTTTQNNLKADIYFNKAGFEKDTRVYDETVPNEIGYKLKSSGRKYNDHLGNGVTANDIREWYIRLPQLGNAVCKIWDILSSEDRIWNFAETRADSNVTYNKNTAIGIINTVKDLVGHTLIKKSSGQAETISSVDNNIYYNSTVINGVDVPTEYYYYAYSPNFVQNSNGTYIKDDKGNFKIANKALNYPTTSLYTKQDQWKLTAILPGYEDTIYGLIVTIHRLIGTGDPDSRDINNIVGCINRVSDIIANIDTQLAQNKLLMTDAEGKIVTSDTKFPIAGDKRILTAQGLWESRIGKVTVEQEQSENNDNWDTLKSGTIDVNENDDLEICLNAGNKWIGLAAANEDPKTINILHKTSEQKEHDFAEDVIIAEGIDGSTQTDCAFTIPLLQTDNAGHVIGSSTKTMYVPYGYRDIHIIPVSSSEEELASFYTGGTLKPETTGQTLQVEAGNKWIRLIKNVSEDNDRLIIGHALKNSGLDTIRFGHRPNFGTTITIPAYDFDAAGHLSSIDIEGNSITLPKNSYTQNTNGNVLTSIALDQTLGAFTGTVQYVGDLAITNYAEGTDGTDLVASDTINKALGKLQVQIKSNKTNSGETSSALVAETSAREAADLTLQSNIDNALNSAKTYADNKIADLVDSSPDTLNTLNELAAALGNDSSFATTVANKIGENTTTIDNHTKNENNPHKVTASQIGLGNVTNENKTTMFTSPVFTGVPKAPIAPSGTNTDQIATTAFVNIEVAAEAISRDAAIAAAVKAAMEDLLTNYNITLNPINGTLVLTDNILTVELENEEETEIWLQKQVESDEFADTEAAPMTLPYTLTEAGTYRVKIIRTHNSTIATSYTNEVVYEVNTEETV